MAKLDTSKLSINALSMLVVLETDISKIVNEVISDYSSGKEMDPEDENLTFFKYAKKHRIKYLKDNEYASNNGIEIYEMMKIRYQEVLAPLNFFEFGKNFSFGRRSNKDDIIDIKTFTNDTLSMAYLEFVMSDVCCAMDQKVLEDSLKKVSTDLQERFKIKLDFEENLKTLKNVMKYRIENDSAYKALKKF